jgi:NTP pyrophosphatase (non-canonical NTP hydrolase)
MVNQPLTITDLINKAHANAKEHGWHEPQRSFGELIALCHSELSEALEEYRNGREPTDCYYVCNKCEKGPCALNSEHGADEYDCTPTPSEKPEGIPAELADVVIRIADMCGLYGIDLEEAIREKMEYNKSRPMRHGGKVL